MSISYCPSSVVFLHYKLLLIASCDLSIPKLKKQPMYKNLFDGGITATLLLLIAEKL